MFVVLFLHCLHGLADLGGDAIRLPAKALASLIDVATQGCHWCWFSEISKALQSFGFSHDMLPMLHGGLPRSLVDSLVAIRETIYRAVIQTTWVTPQQPLMP